MKHIYKYTTAKEEVRLFGWITWGMQRKDNSNIETNFS